MANRLFPDITTDIGAGLAATDWFLVADTSDSSSAKDILISALMTYIIANIDSGSVGLSDVDNTSDLGKPISTLQQTEIDTKAEAGFQSGFLKTSSSSPVEMSGVGVLTVTHDLGNEFPSCVTVWDSSKNIIDYDEVTSTSTNVTTIDLGSYYDDMTGTWYVSILGV